MLKRVAAAAAAVLMVLVSYNVREAHAAPAEDSIGFDCRTHGDRVCGNDVVVCRTTPYGVRVLTVRQAHLTGAQGCSRPRRTPRCSTATLRPSGAILECGQAPVSPN
jgi:hypothetical protein